MAPVSGTGGAHSRLAIIATHPIQYYAPWFRYLATHTALAIRVFYLWDFGVAKRNDPGFGHALEWDVPLLTGYDYEFVPNASANPGTHHFFGLRNPSLPARLVAYRPDVALLMGYNFASFIQLIMGRVSREVPLLFRGDSNRLAPRSGVPERVRRLLIARVFARFAGVLYVGTANRDYFRHHGVAERKLFRSPHAVDNDRFTSAAAEAEPDALAWKRALGIPPEDLVVLFAGKWEADKRPLDLLRAFARLDRPDTSLLFVGGGALEQQLRREAAAHAKVFFAPFQNQTAMPRTYCTGDVFVLPSEAETWGLAVNEAMCMARAVIVSDRVGCARDLVEHGASGLVFPAGNVDALTQALAQALSDRARLEAWGQRGRAIIRQFDYRSATAGLLEALRGLNVPAAAA
jgi:glycosyltransferase involved in cell wall biosynthesis